MSTATVTYNFAAGTPAVADEVDINFADLTTYLNTEVVTRDAAIAMTGILALPATDPTTANQAARKAYVDAGDAASVAAVSGKVNRSGDTMTGILSLINPDPTQGPHATHKTYVDAGDATTLANATTLVNNEAATRTAADTVRVTAPAIATNPKIVGSSTVGVTAGGNGKFAIATGLATSLISATVSNGDSGAGAGIGTAILVEVDWASTTTGSLVVQCLRNDNSAAVANGVSVRVNWIALGS